MINLAITTLLSKEEVHMWVDYVSCLAEHKRAGPKKAAKSNANKERYSGWCDIQLCSLYFPEHCYSFTKYKCLLCFCSFQHSKILTASAKHQMMEVIQWLYVTTQDANLSHFECIGLEEEAEFVAKWFCLPALPMQNEQALDPCYVCFWLTCCLIYTSCSAIKVVTRITCKWSQ